MNYTKSVNGEKIENVASEAAKIKKDYPKLTYKQAIEKAREVLGHDTFTGNKTS